MSCAPCQKAKNLSSSIATWAMAGMPLATPDTLQNRLTTCDACNLYKKPICSKCGCLIFVKARLQTSQCPEGKW
jgi:hypothetical protein